MAGDGGRVYLCDACQYGARDLGSGDELLKEV